MEDFNKPTSMPIFKKIDRDIFDRIDKFKLTPGYNNLQDFYNGLEEEQQKIFKGLTIVVIFTIPLLVLGFLFWQNTNLKSELEMRKSLISKSYEIIGQKQSLREVSPNVLSENPIDGESMMTSRLSNVLSSGGIDLSKIQVTNYSGEMTSGTIMRAEADFKFTNVSTEELMNVFSAMISREKFRIQTIDINRNADTNMLKGQFHAIHFSSAENAGGEE